MAPGAFSLVSAQASSLDHDVGTPLRLSRHVEIDAGQEQRFPMGSLHGAAANLPHIHDRRPVAGNEETQVVVMLHARIEHRASLDDQRPAATKDARCSIRARSEEHTSELQSRRDLVCRLLLEKKKITLT